MKENTFERKYVWKKIQLYIIPVENDRKKQLKTDLWLNCDWSFSSLFLRKFKRIIILRYIPSVNISP